MSSIYKYDGFLKEINFFVNEIDNFIWRYQTRIIEVPIWRYLVIS